MGIEKIRKATRMKRDGYLGKEYSKWALEAFGREYSEDVARRIFYGVERTLNALDEEVERKNEKTKCLIINDLHLPHERGDLLDIIRQNKDVDYIIIGGDMIDCESCSSFDSMNRPSVEEEIAYAHNWICKVNEIIDPNKTKIIAIEGNHEARYKRDIMRMQQKQMQSMLNPNLLAMLQDGFTTFVNGKRKAYEPISNFEYIDNWYVKLFDNMVVAHPLNFSNVGGKVSEQIAEYMLNQGIIESDDMVVFGHTHKFSMMKNNRRQGVFVLENACVCKEHDYAKVGKLAFTPQNYGYSIVEFVDGEKVDVNDVKFVHLN